MKLLSLLSSEAGDRTQESNERVAAMCLENPGALTEIAEGLKQAKKPKLAGDCAEVMTKVAERQPQLVVPYADELLAKLNHRAAKVRWEAAHALALIAPLVPAAVIGALPVLRQMLSSDASIVVRDYTIEMIACAAKAGEDEARTVFPLLQEALTVWEGRHRGLVLKGLVHVSASAPGLRPEISNIAAAYAADAKTAVAKSAKALMKSCAT
ncbi:hypothetical protein [Paenibacillus arenilitoris]|uniref:HEAT repeat domain-containing protein n=1 Tax=Paenibacillus arenilitoris TaxID=2772299 RepID=A0A927H873_9BACL|nr:hypothetical protein [Paenibacillus arenilitoris]MBD2870334.1 hypothetical protein [Paenibacillus arenilitoris]